MDGTVGNVFILPVLFLSSASGDCGFICVASLHRVKICNSDFSDYRGNIKWVVIMKIEGLLSGKYIELNLELTKKSQVIDAMLSIAGLHPGVENQKKLRYDVLKREKEMSTGIGKQIALPHAKTDAVSAPVLALATLKNRINFDSIDNEPVGVVFLLATPEDMLAEHLKLLGRITRLAGRADIREKLMSALVPSEVLELFREEEKDFPQI